MNDKRSDSHANQHSETRGKPRDKAVNPASKRRQVGPVMVAASRWVDALNTPQDASRLEAACADDMAVERMGVFDRRGQLAETFRGVAAVSEWLSRLPAGISFELATGPEAVTHARKPAWQLRYLYRIAELQFSNGGTWLLRLAEDGRLVWLRHDPDPLPDGMGAGGTDHGGTDHGDEAQHDHDHG